MRKAQLIVIAIALGAGALAFLGMRSIMQAPTRAVIQAERVDATQVLVARTDLGLGQAATEGSFRWQDWPKEALNPSFVTSANKPNAIQEFTGAIARVPVLAGEPITASKLVKPGSGGVLAAILPAGMRAVSTKITEHSAAAKLILPNDHVDVILVQRRRSDSGAEAVTSETILRDVRVLAIGQQIETKDGKKTAEGNVATLQLTARQAELLAEANTRGDVFLSLRSLVADGKEQANVTRIVRLRN
ncbi:MAG TPA: Flp pilus assembly protein CpaB [Hyphomicrobiaceae bacterium]|nr:Flp pilus assembly protein CpaB [Hyphomicrobiaceae bacterium]